MLPPYIGLTFRQILKSPPQWSACWPSGNPVLFGWWKFQGHKPKPVVFHEHPWKFHLFFRGHSLFLPLAPFQELHENFYQNSLPHLVSTTCKLTPFQMQLERVLNSLYQKQPSRGVPRKMCSENMHAANFIYRRTPMLKCNAFYWIDSFTWVFFYTFAGYIQNTFS